jgi:hypothetical protein
VLEIFSILAAKDNITLLSMDCIEFSGFPPAREWRRATKAHSNRFCRAISFHNRQSLTQDLTKSVFYNIFKKITLIVSDLLPKIMISIAGASNFN